MTRKDYIAIAAAIRATDAHEATCRDYAEGWHAAASSIRERIADVLAADNPRFDRDRFNAAAGPVQ